MGEPYDPNWQPGEPYDPNEPPSYPPTAYQPPPPTYQPPPATAQYPRFGPPPAGYPGYPTAPLPTWGAEPPKRRTGLVVGLLALAVTLVGGGIGVGILLARAHNTSASLAQQGALPPPISLPVVPSYPIPTLSVPGLPPTAPPSGDPADQQQIATNATRFLHALAADQPAVFCPLWDPDDLAAVLAHNGISSCDQLRLRSALGKLDDAAFAITDPGQIEVTGADATIPNADISPAGFPGDVVMHKDTDGTWKVVFTEH